MLYLLNNTGETCKDQLCQHPQCWQNNVRRVKEAVRRRNGIEETQIRERQREYSQKKPEVSFDESTVYSLPTLKVVDVMQDMVMVPCNGDDDGGDGSVGNTSPLVPTIKQHTRHFCSRGVSSTRFSRFESDTSYGTQAPHTTPVSPRTSSGAKKHTSYNESSSALEQRCEAQDGKPANKITFHEIYDRKEVCEDWQETFISTAYLVWCPTKKKKDKRHLRASSATTDYRTRGFKNITDEILPKPVEKTGKKWRNLKYPTGGQPYSPCRSPLMKHDYKQLEYFTNGDFIMTTTNVEVPDSLITKKKILESKTNSRNKDQVSQMRNTNNTTVLVDISSQLSLNTIGGSGTSGNDEENEIKKKEQDQSTKDDDSKRPKTAEPAEKLPPESGPRKILPIPSVGVPWGLIPDEDGQHHCKNSIPHTTDLGVIMEPVVYLPRSASSGQQRACANPPKEVIPSMGNLVGNVDERGHITSAYRFSPKYVFAPAPTPITPRTRDSMRRRISDGTRPHTNPSLARTLVGVPTVHYDDGGKKVPGGQQMSGVADDHVIAEVQESNRLEGTGAEFSSQKAESQANIDEKFCDLESSFRTISPSSRTNIPADIWAELRGDVLNDVNRTISGDRSTLRPSGYSYFESSWKPSPSKLPRSFTSQRTYTGAYSQTILPPMPASLTVVPVPSIQRASTSNAKPRGYHGVQKPVQNSGILMPRVPVGTPEPRESLVPVDARPPDCPPPPTVSLSPVSSPLPSDTLDSCGTQVDISSGSCSEQLNGQAPCKDDLTSSTASELLSGQVLSKGNYDAVGTGTQEYLITHDVISNEEVCKNTTFNKVLPSEEVVTDITQTRKFGASDSKQPIEKIEQDNRTGAIGFSGNSAVPSEASEESMSLVNTERDNNGKTHDENRTTESLVESSSNITTESELSVEPQVLIAPQLSGTTSNAETLTDSSVGTMTKVPSEDINGKPQQSEESKIEGSNTDEIKKQESEKMSEENMTEGSNAQESKTRDINVYEQESKESLTSFNELHAETSNESILSNVGSDFQLEPLNVDSELFQPITIESDLLLLTDSFLDLSYDDLEEKIGDGDGDL